jgi:hypothetical protein
VTRPAVLLAALLAGSIAGCGDRPAAELEAPAGEPVAEEGTLSVPQRCEVPAPPPGIRTVQVVFSCDEVAVGSWRPLPDTAADSLVAALEALLAGPNPQERDAGLASFFSEQTAGMLNSAEVRDGVAYIDFRNFAAVIPNASSSAGSTRLLDQIAGTVFQFDGIGEAELTFDGSCDAFWNWLQRGCQRLTRSVSSE